MLIKITLILLVIDIALYIIARVYFNALSAGNKFRIACTTNYKTLKNIYFDEPFYSFARNEIKRKISGHGYEIIIAATFPKDMPQEKARKIMKDRVAKWKAEQEGL